MPPTFQTLRIGELLRVTAHVPDNLGGATLTDNPQFTENLGGIFQVVSGEFSHQCLISGEAPGQDMLGFAGQDGFDNGVVAEDPVTVLDGSQFQCIISGETNCTVSQVQGQMIIRIGVDPPADPGFFLKLIARDERMNSERGTLGPAYALSDGPNLCTDNGRLQFTGHGSTVSDDDDVHVLATARGAERIHAWAVAAAAGALISGELVCTIVTASNASLSSEPV